MSNTIFIIAHAPLANALRDCAMHVYPECAGEIIALDVLPDAQPEETLRDRKSTRLNSSHRT